MASITRRVWFGRGPTGRKVKKVAFGFTVEEGGKRLRKYDAGWSREDAEKALAAYHLGIKPVSGSDGTSLSFGDAITRYLEAKAKKHSLKDDRHRLERLKVALGAATPLSAITASRIAEYKAARLKATIQRDGEVCPIAPATLNRELAALRCLLRMACNEWEVIPKVPHIRLEREAQGRLRYLTNEEEVRLLAACEKSRNKDLHSVVTIALETGMRRGEILGLTWDRVDLSRGMLRLEITKSGRRREVAMRQAVYNMLAARPGPRVGRVWPDRQIRKAFETAVAVAQLDDFRFHDLRHTFASNFVMRGGSLQSLKEILGHGSMAMTLRYAHLAPEHVRGEMERTAKGTPMSQGLSGALEVGAGMRRILEV
jgi:integrase